VERETVALVAALPRRGLWFMSDSDVELSLIEAIEEQALRKIRAINTLDERQIEETRKRLHKAQRDGENVCESKGEQTRIIRRQFRGS
jgi:hypothetical protein